MLSEVLYALLAAVVLYVLVSVVLKAIGSKLRVTRDSNVEGEPSTRDDGQRHPE